MSPRALHWVGDWYECRDRTVAFVFDAIVRAPCPPVAWPEMDSQTLLGRKIQSSWICYRNRTCGNVPLASGIQIEAAPWRDRSFHCRQRLRTWAGVWGSNSDTCSFAALNAPTFCIGFSSVQVKPDNQYKTGTGFLYFALGGKKIAKRMLQSSVTEKWVLFGHDTAMTAQRFNVFDCHLMAPLGWYGFWGITCLYHFKSFTTHPGGKLSEDELLLFIL